MFHRYLDSLYKDWLWRKSLEELIGVIKLIVEIIETKYKCKVIGTLDIHLQGDKNGNL